VVVKTRVDLGSGGIEDGAFLEESLALVFVDVEFLEEALPEESEEGFDGGWGLVVERDGSAGAFVVSAGGTEAIDDGAEDFAALSADLADAG
jgi:hypothetical protein